jgi:hypothetical protein
MAEGAVINGNTRRIAKAHDGALTARPTTRRIERPDEHRRRLVNRKASLDALGRLGGLMSGGQWRSPSNVGRGTLGAVARGT